MAHPFDQAGRLWRARVDRAREYDLVDESDGFTPGPWSAFVPRSDYDRARRLRDDLVAGYRGRAFEDVFCGREVACPGGICYVLESRSAMDLDGRDPGRGYRTVADLARHPLYRREAARLLDSVVGGNTRDLVEQIGGRHRRSDPLLLEASRFHAPEDFVFLDIETLGLFSRPIILIGLARVGGGSITTRQYLLRSVEEEEAALTAALPDLEAEGAALVTFNGRAFDLPYIRERLAYYGIPAGLGMPHFDVLHFARRRWRDSFATCRLSALETEVLGVGRESDVPGRMVPEFYDAYQRTGNPGPLVPVVEHNRQDLISLARLFAHLRGDGDGGA